MAYTASGDVRPDETAADVRRALAAGAVVVTPAIYALYDQRNAPADLREPLLAAAREGGAALFVSGVDPGWGNDVLPVLVSALAGEIDQVRCQEIFDYSTYDAPDAVRYAVGMGEPMDYEPLMVAPGVPDGLGRTGAPGRPRPRRRGGGDPRDPRTARARRGRHQLDGSVREGHPGGPALRGAGARRRPAGGRRRARHPDRPRWRRTGPSRPTAGTAPTRWSSRPAAHRGQPRGHRGGREPRGRRQRHRGQPARQRDPWLRSAEPGLYDGLDVPLTPAVGRLTHRRKASA